MEADQNQQEVTSEAQVGGTCKPQEEAKKQQPIHTSEEKPASVPAGFEEFNLDDIEVIESRVFA